MAPLLLILSGFCGDHNVSIFSIYKIIAYVGHIKYKFIFGVFAVVQD